VKKVAIMTDSNTGITQKEASELGIFVLPMPFMVEGETFFEDISLTQEEFFLKQENGLDIVTSQPSPESVMTLWNEILKEYDEIVHLPMSSALSGSCETAMILAREEEYEGKVYIVDNKRISVLQTQAIKDSLMYVKQGKSGQEVKDLLEADSLNYSVYIMVDTLYYLKKGGRITATAAALGTLLKIKPILQIQGGKLDAFAKARTTNQGKTTMMNAIKNDIQTRFGGMVTPPNVTLHVAYTKDLDAAMKLKEELSEEFPGHIINIQPLSLSIACHIGPGALAIAVTQNV